MIAAPLIAGNDIRKMGPDTAEILLNKEVIAIDQDSLGADGKRVGRTGDIERWERPLASGDFVVAIFNLSNQRIRAVIRWNPLEIDNSYSVGDLWAHVNRGTPSQFSSESVAAHGVVMLRLNEHT